jgi:hypothetical protein
MIERNEVTLGELVSAAALSAREPVRCPITGYRCEGDLSHLCKDYGCARKAGLSPRSEENL